MIYSRIYQEIQTKIKNYKAETYLKYKGINNDKNANTGDDGVNYKLLLKSSQYDLNYKIIELTINSNATVNDSYHHYKQFH